MVNEELQKVIEALPVVHQIVGKDSYLTVLDEESIVRGYAVPASEKPKLNIGDKMQDTSGGFAEVMATGEKKFNYLPKEVMGKAFEGVLVPVKDGNKVVGCLIYSYCVDDKNDARDMAEEFKESIRLIDVSIQEVIDSTKGLFDMLSAMTELTDGINHDVQEVTDVVQKISGNASRSNILALNASIEAARGGEAGRGFAVVANSMGELANDSGCSAKEIGEKLDVMREHLLSIGSSITDANNVAKGHMDSVCEVHEKLAKTIALAEEMQKKI